MVLTNNEDAFEVPREMLTASGLWPSDNKTWRYKLRTTISWVAILALCLTMWMEFFNDLHDLKKLSGIIYILVSFLNAITKQIGFTFKHKTLQETLIHLKSSVFTAHTEDLDHYMASSVKFSTNFAKIFRVLVACGVILMTIFPIIEKHPLPFPFPYDVGNYHFLMYTFQVTTESISAWNHMSIDFMCISLMDIASAQLDILCEKIVLIKGESEFYEDEKKREQVALVRLKHCVDHHLAIIKLIDNIESIFSVGILAQYLAASVIICNTIFHFLLVPLSFEFIMLVDYLICILIQLYYFCWYGNTVLTKTRQVGDACYSFNWYDYGLPVRKYIFIIMERSKRPSGITALKFTTLSMKSLASILQWSYSMLTLLLNMYTK